MSEGTCPREYSRVPTHASASRKESKVKIRFHVQTRYVTNTIYVDAMSVIYTTGQCDWLRPIQAAKLVTLEYWKCRIGSIIAYTEFNWRYTSKATVYWFAATLQRIVQFTTWSMDSVSFVRKHPVRSFRYLIIQQQYNLRIMCDRHFFLFWYTSRNILIWKLILNARTITIFY